jgi:hypothetical protein
LPRCLALPCLAFPHCLDLPSLGASTWLA